LVALSFSCGPGAFDDFDLDDADSDAPDPDPPDPDPPDPPDPDPPPPPEARIEGEWQLRRMWFDPEPNYVNEYPFVYDDPYTGCHYAWGRRLFVEPDLAATFESYFERTDCDDPDLNDEYSYGYDGYLHVPAGGDTWDLLFEGESVGIALLEGLVLRWETGGIVCEPEPCPGPPDVMIREFERP
jgi:hypothetical protein